MATLKLHLIKAGLINPQSKEKGYIARVVTNGTADYDDIVADACRNTTLHKAEAKVAFDLCMETVAEKLKQGFIVDLGPTGRLYPSCTGEWVANAEELSLNNVTPKINYRPADDILSAIKGATLRWVKASETADEEVVDKDEDGPTGKPIGS